MHAYLWRPGLSIPNDIEIANAHPPQPITQVAESIGLNSDDLTLYGRDKAKVNYTALEKSHRKEGQLILVSAITPTPAGEGKTTVSIGLAQGLKRLNKSVTLALREPSMGPLFGIKGGATGGGYSQLIPMEEINLHFNGDFPAISAANNLLAAALDNAIYHRKLPALDPRRVIFPRVLDINDRALRNTIIGLGGRKMGVPRETEFDITAASEVMAILALSNNYRELKERLNRILLGITYNDQPVTAKSLNVTGAMAAILKDAIHPNLVQSLEGVPAFVHCGPFANIAHGSNSVLATRMALAHSDYTVTEAGFGFDLGAEKFFDITCRAGDFAPEICVLVVTVRALKMHSGVASSELRNPDPEAVRLGLPNLEKHIENINKFQVPVVVAINQFQSDSPEEIRVIENYCSEKSIAVATANVHELGGEGGIALAQTVLDRMCDDCQLPLKPLYDYNWTPEEKIRVIASEIYGAEHVDYTTKGKQDLEMVYHLGYDKTAICIAKTQKSLSDNPKLLGRPKDFVVTVRHIEIAAGAGFIIPLTGDILRMPGMPESPAYEKIDLLDNGKITGLQ